MARMHKIDLNELGVDVQETMLWGKMQQFFALIPEKFSDPVKQER